MRTKTDEGWGRLYRITAKGLAKINLNAYESKILWAIVYKTIAFNKESDNIPKRQFEELTGIDRRNHKRPINSLLKKGVIWRKGNEYRLCKKFLEFEDVSNQIQKEEVYSTRVKSVFNQSKKCIQPNTLIRSYHKNIHKKGLSPSEKRDKREEYKKGLKMLRERLGIGRDKKRKNN